MSHEPQVLPLVVLSIREQIDRVFARYVGPIASEIGREEFDHWRESGQIGPLGLHRYISRLARHIPEENSRRAFMREASECIKMS